MLNKDDIEKFQALSLSNTGIALSELEAEDHASRLIKLVKVLIEEIKEKENHKNDKEK
jgi:hypothetical protein